MQATALERRNGSTQSLISTPPRFPARLVRCIDANDLCLPLRTGLLSLLLRLHPINKTSRIQDRTAEKECILWTHNRQTRTDTQSFTLTVWASVVELFSVACPMRMRSTFDHNTTFMTLRLSHVPIPSPQVFRIIQCQYLLTKWTDTCIMSI